MLNGTTWLIMAVCMFSCYLAIVYDRDGQRIAHLLTKSFCSLCFLAQCVLSLMAASPSSMFSSVAPSPSSRKNHHDNPSHLIFIAQLFSLGGDIALVWKESDLLFQIGGFLFLITHVLYMVYFAMLLKAKLHASSSSADSKKSDDEKHHSSTSSVSFTLHAIMIVVVIIASYGVVGVWMWPKIPTKMYSLVVPYTIMISIMVALSPAGSGTLFNGIHDKKCLLRIVGSVLFYASDICVAREKFVESSIYNRVVGLPLYFLAQIIIAAAI